MPKFGEEDERFYTCKRYQDRKGRWRRGKIFRARFEWQIDRWVYQIGSLEVFRFRKHDGTRMSDDDDVEEISFSGLFKEDS